MKSWFNIDWSFIDERSKKRILLYGMILFIVILCADYLLQPQIEKYRSLKSEEVSLLYNLDSKNQIKQYQRQLDELNKQENPLLQPLIQQSDVSVLLEKLFTLAKDDHLLVLFLAPQESMPHRLYTAIPILTVIQGEYHQLLAFLKAIAKVTSIELNKFIFSKIKGKEMAFKSSLPTVELRMKFTMYQRLLK